MPERKRALLVVNDRSGTADAELAPALERLASGGIEVESFRPEDPKDINDIIRSEADKTDMVLLGGGDGTLSGSAAAVLDVGRPVGVFPMGTANDFARGLEIPTDLAQAADVILGGRIRQIDVGLVDDRPFINVATVGLAAEIAEHHTGERKKYLKLLSYPLSWLDARRAHQPFRASLECDDTQVSVRCSQVAVGSGRHYGGGLTIAAEAEVDDGWLRLYYVEPMGLLGWMRLAPRLRFGTLGQHENARLLKGKSIRIETAKPKRVNVDGELIGQTPARFGILPRALGVYVPEPET